MGTQPPADVVAAARAAAAKWRIPASPMLAQWALESGWGKHEPGGSDNPFGEKAAAGAPGVTAPTTEDVGGRVIHLSATFRVFPDLASAFDFHAQHLAASRWYAPARACVPDIEKFCKALGGGTPARPNYSTNPDYGAELMTIIRDSNLEAYDA